MYGVRYEIIPSIQNYINLYRCTIKIFKKKMYKRNVVHKVLILLAINNLGVQSMHQLENAYVTKNRLNQTFTSKMRLGKNSNIHKNI